MFQITAVAETFPLARAFAISRGSKTEAQVVTVSIRSGGFTGRGECVPYGRYGESVASVLAQIESLPASASPETLQQLMPPGAARNAVDCAFWDWRCKSAGRRAWQLASLPEPEPLATAYTLPIDSAENMRAMAQEHRLRPLLKIKLGGENDIALLEAVRQGAPKARLIVDANEAWTSDLYRAIAPALLRLGVEMAEQPLPAGADEDLAEIGRILPVCADESCHDRASLAGLRGKYDIINIKLDKTGGLTEALALRDEARAQGFAIMAGCMVCTSLGIAPSLLVAQAAQWCDLDGPLLLARDRDPALRYSGSVIYPPAAELWG